MRESEGKEPYTRVFRLCDPLVERGKDGTMTFLDSLAPAEREAFTAVAVPKVFARGARIMSEGEKASQVMVILHGWTRITVRDNGRERVVAERGPGQLLGERGALRPNVRSATVTAASEVGALVMKAEDFASFISSHERVLGVVEDQIYDRLTEDPDGYGQDGWPGTVSRQAGQAASTALAARLRPKPLAGENCTVLLTDVVGFGAPHRTDWDRAIIRREHMEIIQRSLAPVWAACIWQDRGDGLLIVAPPQVTTAKIMNCINRELPDQLRLHNRTFAEAVCFNLRVAVNVGPVVGDLVGFNGESIIRTARLVEAPVLKDAMKRVGAVLGIAVSPFVYETAIGVTGDVLVAAEYEQVEVNHKDFAGPAWVRLAEQGPRDQLRAGRGGVHQVP
jgi:hypothetical protein